MPKLDTTLSQRLFSRAQQVIPGGVNSPVRAFRAVGREPVFIRALRGPTSPMPTATTISIMSVHGDR